jgi:hypothetical protein
VSVAHPIPRDWGARPTAFLLPSRVQDIHRVLLHQTAISLFAHQTHSLPPTSLPVPPNRCSRPDRAVVLQLPSAFSAQFKVASCELLPLKQRPFPLQLGGRAVVVLRLPGPPPFHSHSSLLCV